MGNITFDANTVEPTSFDAVPVGDYTVAITESAIKDTKAGTGKYIAMTLEILDGQYKGRKVWSNLNIQNPNPKAQQIGLGQLSEICRACGKMNISDTSELHNVPFRGKIAQEVGQDGSMRNVFKRAIWKETSTQSTGFPSASPKGTPPSGAAAFTDDEIPF